MIERARSAVNWAGIDEDIQFLTLEKMLPHEKEPMQTTPPHQNC